MFQLGGNRVTSGLGLMCSAVLEPVLRRACDRCHLSKLSCQREGDASCTRCLKANKPCNTSPSLRNKRSRPTQHPLTPDGTERGSQNKAQRHDNLATENDGFVTLDHTQTCIGLLI